MLLLAKQQLKQCASATVIIVSGYLMYKNIYLFSIALVVIPLIAFLMLAVVKRVRKMQSLAETAIGKFISNIDEMKTGMRTTKMAAQEDSRAGVSQISTIDKILYL